MKEEDGTRTLSQNARLWAMLTDISEQVPWIVDAERVMMTPMDWKEVLSAALRQEQRIAKGINGGFVVLGMRTSKMKVAEMTDLMTLMEAFGAEHQVKFRAPDGFNKG